MPAFKRAMPSQPPRVSTRAVNGSAAPVCPISRSQAVPGKPPTPRIIPGLTRVSDLPSVINNLNLIINYINSGPSDYQEVQRQTETVRIYNPNDQEQYVDVERIMYTRLDDPVLGGRIVWEY